MTRQDLDRRLDQEAKERNYSGLEGSYWGTWVEAGEGIVGLVLICKEFHGPYSVCTPVEPPDASEEWAGLTELWEVEWRDAYQVVEAEYQPLRTPPQDPLLGQDYLRWDAQRVDSLDAVGDVLRKSGKHLTDIVPMTIPWRPLPSAG